VKKLLFAFLPLLFLLTSCGNSFRVYHDSDPTINYNIYKTYSFLDWTEGNKKTITGMELERIRTAFARELETKELAYQEEGSDLKVKITVYFREGRDFSYGYYYPSAYYYMERALAIDIFENETKKHIWHGAAVGEVGRTPEERAEELPEQVQEILKSFPKNTEDKN
jgi:hypothetical protein